MREVSQLIAALWESRSFEDAAGHALRAMMGVCERALAASPFSQGRILRGTVQLRPGDSFQRLVVLEAGAARSGASADAPLKVDSSTFVTSASAWHAVVESSRPVSIDVNLGTFRLYGPPGSNAQTAVAPALFGVESRQRFLGRQASHVVVLPLLVPGSGVDGMISIEAECAAATGQDFIWPTVLEQLEVLANLAAFSLTHLPPKPGHVPPVDEYLPVIGATMAGLVPILRVFAQQEETILLSGPTGSGKSRLARWCHEQSQHRAQRFVSLDLVGMSEDAQLAGLVRGAGRNGPEGGRDEVGTIFIDEIDKLSPKAQGALLRMMDTQGYRAPGDAPSDVPTHVRFIVGTHEDLRAAVSAGQFREDLYYRINVLPVRVPPLEERRDEVGGWAHYMLLRRHRETVPEGQARLTPEAERALGAAAWPGNLRQLDNIIRRSYTLAMVEPGGLGREVVLEERHVAHALAYEGATSSPLALVELLVRAAIAFVHEAQGRPGGLNLDVAHAFAGFVLATAVQQLGREEAFRLLGKETLVRNRNHHKALRREVDKVDQLLRALGQEKSPFEGMDREDPDEPSSGGKAKRPRHRPPKRP